RNKACRSCEGMNSLATEILSHPVPSLCIPICFGSQYRPSLKGFRILSGLLQVKGLESHNHGLPVVKSLLSGIRYPSSRIYHPISNIRHLETSIQHPESAFIT